jgi:nucleoside phosphorylase
MDTGIGLIIATKIEAEPFISGLGLKLIEKKPFRLYEGGGFTLVLSDIGKANAAMATTYLISQRRPPVIINLGAAGATDRKFGIGDIYHIDKIYEPDRPRLTSSKPVAHKPDTLKGFRTATLATQDRPAIRPADRAAAGKYAGLVDMEGGSVVQACRAFGVKAYLFKVVTDNDGCGAMEIIRNMLSTRKELFRFFSERVLPALRVERGDQ